MKEMRNYLTTGEFARLCGVKKHTLFHYDAMGVFSPAATGENGYRYYAVAQIEVFHVIVTLKELDMPLAEIKAYLNRRSPAQLCDLLEREDALLTEKLKNLRRMRDMARQKAALTRWALGLDYGAIGTEERAAAFLVCTPVSHITEERAAALEVAAHVRFCEDHHIYSAHAIGSMLSLDAVCQGDLDDGYTHFYTQLDQPPKGTAVFTRAAGTYLCACHVGGYDTVGATYRRLLDWAEGRGLTLTGPFFEDVLLDELTMEGQDNYVLRISIRV